MDVKKYADRIVRLLESYDYGFPLDKPLDINGGRLREIRAGQVEEVVAIKGRKRKGTFITITLINKGDVPAEALVEWGSYGAVVQTALVDFCRGTTLSLCATDIRITARNLATPDPDDSNVGLAQLGAFVGYMPAPGETKAWLTRELGAIAGGGGTAEVEIPLYARFVNILRTPLQNAMGNDQHIFFLDAAGAIIGGYTSEPDGAGIPARIPNRARTLRWENSGGGGAGIDNAVVIFTLSM